MESNENIIIQFTSPIYGNSYVTSNDEVYTNGELNTEAVVVHDNGIIRVDINNDGIFEINPPEEL